MPVKRVKLPYEMRELIKDRSKEIVYKTPGLKAKSIARYLEKQGIYITPQRLSQILISLKDEKEINIDRTCSGLRYYPKGWLEVDIYENI